MNYFEYAVVTYFGESVMKSLGFFITVVITVHLVKQYWWCCQWWNGTLGLRIQQNWGKGN